MTPEDFRKFSRQVVAIHQDLNWLTEKALGSFFTSNPNGRAEITTRHERIRVLLDTMPRILDLEMQHRMKLAQAVDDLRRETITAIIGLQHFLTALSNMEMGPKTRVVVQEQLRVIQSTLDHVSAPSQG